MASKSCFSNVKVGRFVDISTVEQPNQYYNSFVLSQLDSDLDLESVCHATPTYFNPHLAFPVVMY